MRRFGIELEVVAAHSMQAVYRAIEAAGVSVNYVGGYRQTPATATAWEVKYDGSLSTEGGRSHAMEIVSPPLNASTPEERAASFDAIRTVCDILQDMDASANRSCGMHVHVSDTDWTGADIRRIVQTYSACEAEFDKLVPPSRRGGSAHYAQGLGRVHLRDIDPAGTPADVARRLLQAGMRRECKVNVQRIGAQSNGTIEFRHAGGTAQASKAIGWARLILEFVDMLTGAPAPAAPAPVTRVEPPPAAVEVGGRTYERPAFTHYQRPNAQGLRTAGLGRTILDLINREGGATVPELLAATGFERDESVRGAVSDLRRACGYDIETLPARTNGGVLGYRLRGVADNPVTVYRETAPAAPAAPETPAAPMRDAWDWERVLSGLSDETLSWTRRRMAVLGTGGDAAN